MIEFRNQILETLEIVRDAGGAVCGGRAFVRRFTDHARSNGLP